MKINSELETLYDGLYSEARGMEITKPKVVKKYRKFKTNTKGIYFLYTNECITYVGKSSYSIEGRLWTHRNSKKRFDRVAIIELPNYADTIAKAEYYYINLFNPYYNKKDKDYQYDYKIKASYKELKDKVHTQLYTKLKAK